MPTRRSVLEALGSGRDYERVGALFGIPAGQAFMIATGLPADGGDSLAPEDLSRPGLLQGSSQHLVNPEPENPTGKDQVREWIRSMAARDVPMREAADRRDAEPEEPREPEDTDVLTVLRRAHNQVDALLQQLEAIPGGKKGGSAVHRSRRASIVDMMTVRLSSHEAVEERMLWPKVRELLPDGDMWADRGLEQEQEGKDTLAALGGCSPHEERFDDLVEQLSAALRKHVALEDLVFLKLDDVMEDERARQKLGKRMASAERRGPTRPHPHAPSRPPGVQVAGAVGSAMDSLRDHLGTRPADRKGKGADEVDREIRD
ncbi:MAG TPA: hemerythrin domain-containing protein [Acidimicrobiales bacterium]|nr:hemerythrin domain-containing protein [Acidimicrobiales bacterium]